MSTLAALKFNTATGAEQALDEVKRLSKEHLLNLEDAAIVTWPAGKKKPKTKQMTGTTGTGALWGAFWGLLFGLIFFVPILGTAVGVGLGALAGHFADVGIDDDFIKAARSKVTEGTSALFLMVSNVTEDKVADAVKGLDAEVISTNLTKEQDAQLRAAFADEA